MAETLWHYLENQFDNSTKTSRLRLHAQGIFHSNTLANAPAAISAALVARFNAAWTPFSTKYGQWQNYRGQLKGATQVMEESFEALEGDDIESIESAFKVGYKRGTPEHTSAFPLGREPFQSGSMDARKSALDALVTRIGQLVTPLSAALGALSVESDGQAAVDAAQFRLSGMVSAQGTATARQTAIAAARVAQDALENHVSQASDTLEPLRVTLADALYANMMQLGLHFFARGQRPQVEAFFDLELLQESASEEEPVPAIPPVPPPPGP